MKRLSLKKRMIARLDAVDMDAVLGGMTNTYGDVTCAGGETGCFCNSRANPTTCLSERTRCPSDCNCTSANCPSINPTVCC